jgi:hypothetical protein
MTPETSLVVLVHIVSGVAVMKTLTVLLGGAVTCFAYRAYRRTGSRPLRALTIGIGLITLGGVFAGVIDQAVTTLLPAIVLSRSTAMLVESLFTAAGFAVLLYSLYTE